MRRKRVVIIDSGVDDFRKELLCSSVIHIDLNIFEKYDVDDIGHGTAVAFIIANRIPSVEIYSIKLFGRNYHTVEDDYIHALQYIYDNLDVDLINISSGIVLLQRREEFHDICDKLSAKNIHIVAAFANQGVKSYPACFDSVIGVYWSTFCLRPDDYIFVENSPIDIMGYAGKLRLPWTDGEYKYISGSSFASARVSNYLLRNADNDLSLTDIKELLRKRAKSIESFNVPPDIQERFRKQVATIRSAIVLPVNKECHAIIGNNDLLSFNIGGVFDIRLFNNIGKNVKDFVFGCAPLDHMIKSYTDIEWDDSFDTVILGHTVYINHLLNMDFCEYILDLCIKHKKNLFAFDTLEYLEEKVEILERGGNFVINYNFNNSLCTDNTFGSMDKLPVPVLGVFGTSSKQGKFNIQLDLRRRFLSEHYSVGQLGTEPSSILFGFDIAYPFGYNSAVSMTAQEETYYLNHELGKLRNVDIVIIGSQSNTVPYSFGNVYLAPFSQQNLLFASEPDAIVLAVNFTDDIGYVSRTIKILELYYGCIVVAIVLFPYLKSFEYSVSGDIIRHLTSAEIHLFKERSEKLLNKKAYLNGNKEDMDELFAVIKEFFR